MTYDLDRWSVTTPDRRITAAPNLYDLLPYTPGLDTAYSAWVEQHDTLTEEDLRLIGTQIETWPGLSVISLLMPLQNDDLAALRRSLDSLAGQIYPSWELCITVDSGATADVVRTFAAHDPRIRLAASGDRQGAAASTQTARGQAGGEFVAVLYAGDVLAPHALYEIARELRVHPDADVIFTDEDCADGAGRRTAPFFKPMWSAELLAAHDCVGHLVVYRASLVDTVGGWRPAMEGAQDWDLALRMTAATTPERIRHIQVVLYHRDAAAFPLPILRTAMHLAAGRRAVADWLAAGRIAGAALSPNPLIPGLSRVVFQLPDPAPVVTIIMPTRDRADLLERACAGVLSATAWPADRLELIVVDNGSTEISASTLLRRLEEDRRVRVLRMPGPFNYPLLNNHAAGIAQGAVLVLLNNDIEIVRPDWLAELVRLALRPNIGVAGAKLLYPDSTVQHGGMAVGPDGLFGHILRHATADDPAYLGQLALTRALSAVTGACLAVRKAVFEEAGGLDEVLAVTCNDTDLCLRVRALGYRVVWTPDAVLVHHESATRGQDSDRREPARADREFAHMRDRWSGMLDTDPYHNANLRLQAADAPSVFAPPRRPQPW